MNVQPTDRPTPARVPRQVRALLLPVLLAAVPIVIAGIWGLSWGWADFPECSGGSYFLADLGWVLQGIALGLITGIAVPAVVMARRSWSLTLAVLVVTGVLMATVADAAATHAARSVGCDPFYVHGAGQGILMGMAVGAAPTLLIGAIVALRRGPAKGPGPPAGWGRTGR